MPVKSSTEIANIERQKAIRSRMNNSFIDMLEQLPVRQQRLITGMLANPTASKIELARQAGYKIGTEGGVSHLFKQVMGKLGPGFAELGITQADILESLAEGMKATKSVVNDGTVTEVPDFAVRHKFVETMLRLGDYNPAAKIKIERKDTITLDVDRSYEAAQRRVEQAERGEIPAEYEVVEQTTIN